jgi:hypothetical protein
MKKNKSTKSASKKKISAFELDERFDRGESIMEYADLDSAIFRVNVDFPAWTVTALDQEATRLGISRQALIKVWIAERLDQTKSLRKTGT